MKVVMAWINSDICTSATENSSCDVAMKEFHSQQTHLSIFSNIANRESVTSEEMKSMPKSLKSGSNNNVLLQSLGHEVNANTKESAKINDVEHKSMNKISTPKMSTNQYRCQSTVPSDTHYFKKW